MRRNLASEYHSGDTARQSRTNRSTLELRTLQSANNRRVSGRLSRIQAFGSEENILEEKEDTSEDVSTGIRKTIKYEVQRDIGP
jgi:hypothetical protein